MEATRRERLDPRMMAALCLATTAGVINNGALGPFIPDIANDFNTTVPIVGQAATVSWLISGLAGVFAGPLADHYGHRRLLTAGLLLTVASALGGALAQGYWWLILARLVGGLGFSSTIGVALAIVTLRYRGETRLRGVSIISSALSFATVLGIPLLTQIAAPFSWRGAWVFIAMMAAVAAGLLVLNVPADTTGGTGRFSLRQLQVAYSPLLRARRMYLLFAGAGCQGVLLMAAMTYSGSYFIDELNLSVQQFGLVATATGLAFFLGSLSAGRLGRRDLRKMFSSTTLATGGLLLVAFAGPGGVVVTTALMSVAFFFAGIQVVNIMTLVANETPARLGTSMVLEESMFALGGATGAASGGLLIEIGGFQALGIGLPFIAVLAAFPVWYGRPRQATVEADTILSTAGEDTP